MIRNNLQLGLSVIGLSLFALDLSLPAVAADTVINESGEDGGAGGAGENGGNGGHGSSQSDVEGTIVAQSGDDGDDGDTGGVGGNGEAGGDVDVIIDTPTTDGIVISVDGGDGATGGTGGNGGKGGSGATAVSTVTGVNARGGDGGDGGDGGIGGAGGNGGAGGQIELVVASAVGGDIVLSAVGGDEGKGGVGGAGGDDGIGGFAAVTCALAYGGRGGSGGDGNEGGSAGMGGGGYNTCDGSDGYAGVVRGSLGSPGDDDYFGKFKGADGQDGAGGSITVVLSASVGGNLTANAGTGDISVTLNTGASVGGTIAANEAATSALRFAMKVSSMADYKAAKAYLGDQANALSGSLTINGQTFTWTGFDQLVQALVFAGARKASASEASAAGGPAYLSCSPRAVTAFHKDGGAIELIARRSATQEAFRIGHVAGTVFQSQNTLGWAVQFTGRDAAVSFDVLDGKGTKVASCHA